MRRRLTERPAWLLGTAATVLVLVIVASFYAGKALTAGEGVGAQAPDPTEPVPTDATPAPGETPDFTQPFWYHKWLVQDSQLPRFDQTISGIEVGPTVRRVGSLCDEVNRPEQVDFDEAQASRVGIQFGYLPDGAVVEPQAAHACRGEPAGQEVWVKLPALDERELGDRLRAGESYFDLPHGGRIDVYRQVGGPAFESGIPAQRWFAGEIAGIPAAIARPIFEEGFGDSAVIVHHEGVLTVVRGLDVSLAELIRVAEGLFERDS